MRRRHGATGTWRLGPALLVCALAVGCSGTNSQQAGTEGPFFVRKSPNADGVIVFMHGVIGTSATTWRNSSANAYWPELVRDDPELSSFDIYVFEYPSPLFAQSYNIDEVAENVRLFFESDKIAEYPEVIFIAHSMGGLVARAYLQKYQAVAERVKFIAFYSTPTSGSEMGKLASFLSDNPQFGEMAPIESSGEFLAQQLRAWQAGRFGIRAYCAYETRDTVGVRIVDMVSATVLCTEPLNPLDADHMSIVKPTTINAPAYLVFKNAFRETRAVVSFRIPAGTSFEGAVRSLVALEPNAGVAFENCTPEALGVPLGELSERSSTTEATIRLIAVRAGLEVTTTIRRSDGGAIYGVRCSATGGGNAL